MGVGVLVGGTGVSVGGIVVLVGVAAWGVTVGVEVAVGVFVGIGVEVVVGSGSRVAVGSSSTALTCSAGVLVGSGAVVAVGARVAVGGGDDVGTGVGASGSDSQANTRNIADSAAMVTHEMILDGILRISEFVMIIGLFPRWVASGGHFLECRFCRSKSFIDVVFFDPSHVPYTEDLAGEFSLSTAENDVVIVHNF